jgi:hypothetical protein
MDVRLGGHGRRGDDHGAGSGEYEPRAPFAMLLLMGGSAGRRIRAAT